VLGFPQASYGLTLPLIGLFGASALAAVYMVASGVRRSASRGIVGGVLLLTAATLLLVRAYAYRAQVDALPPLYDIQTDWSDPVAFGVDTLRRRDGSGAPPLLEGGPFLFPGPGQGVDVALLQERLFEIRALEAPCAPDVAATLVAQAMERLGWGDVSERSEGGERYIEAGVRSFWYGLATDVVVRVRPAPGGSRIDVRAASREPVTDLGANAARVRILVDDVVYNAFRSAGR